MLCQTHTWPVDLSFSFFNLFVSFPPLLFSVIEAAALGFKDKDVVLSCLSSHPKDSIYPHAHGKGYFTGVYLLLFVCQGEKKKRIDADWSFDVSAAFVCAV